MAQTTFANSRGIAHKRSNGMSLVFSDACLTPVGNVVVPIPYPNLARSADVIKGSKKVKIDGCMAALKKAKYSLMT